MKRHYLKKEKYFYSQFSMEDITDADYAHAKRVYEDFEIKHLGEYHDLYVQRDTLLLADVFKNVRIMSVYIYDLDRTNFFLSSRIIMASSF